MDPVEKRLSSFFVKAMPDKLGSFAVQCKDRVVNIVREAFHLTTKQNK
jgi:hypothetical protein